MKKKQKINSQGTTGKSVAIILAAGEGSRMGKVNVNKTALPFAGRPIITYGVELFSRIAATVVVVVGAFAQSVKKSLRFHTVLYARQKRRLGTGHAVKVALPYLPSSTDQVFVGYGDHLMFYKVTTIRRLGKLRRQRRAAVALITTCHSEPKKLAWGRILRDNKGNFLGIVEQKDASRKERKIKELNAGLYCFDHQFLRENIKRIERSPVSGEYYLTDLIKIAVGKNLPVVALAVPFSQVGLGINKQEEYELSQKMFLKSHKEK